MHNAPPELVATFGTLVRAFSDVPSDTIWSLVIGSQSEHRSVPPIRAFDLAMGN